MRRLARVSLTSAALLLAVSLAAQDRLSELQDKFKRETDPVHKAKMISRIREEDMKEVRHLTDSGDYTQALSVLGRYRDDVAEAQKALQASGKNAEKHPSGYKELQLAVRQSVREIREIEIGVPNPQHQEYDELRKQLEDIDKELMRGLFPRRPEPGSSGDPESRR